MLAMLKDQLLWKNADHGIVSLARPTGAACLLLGIVLAVSAGCGEGSTGPGMETICTVGEGCDDKDPCTENDKCTGEGECLGEPVSCDDQRDCTIDSCNPEGQCVHELKAGYCLISGVCYQDGQPHPDNPCAECMTAANESEWSNDNTNDCGQDDSCHPDAHCADGECILGDATDCDDENVCTDDSCDPVKGCVNTPNSVSCPDGVCVDGECQCQTHCEGKECGDDGCEGFCGECGELETCIDGLCTCGWTTCGEECCGEDDVCFEGTCCSPQCSDAECGDDGCGGSCGDCPGLLDQCIEGACVCLPSCDEKLCGEDGCGGSCGDCVDQSFCYDGECKAPFVLADTGQTTCYDDTGLVPCPTSSDAFYGQDGTYRDIEMAFADNNDGTVTDLLTGLVWSRCSAGQSGPDCSGAGFVGSHDEATAYCAGNVDGLPGGGWRLPSRIELLSITSFDEPPCTPEPFQAGTAHYWTSTATCTVATISCTSNYCDAAPEGFPGRARCVRGGALETASFVDGDNGTVLDLTTGLVWQKMDDGTKRTWKEALAYCQNLELAGYEDWRLPNAKELPTIADMEFPNKSVDEAYFPEPGEKDYWTSTTMPHDKWLATALATHNNGAMGWEADTKDVSLYVRCVRSSGEAPCEASCNGKKCGEDGCGGSCGSCMSHEECASPLGRCIAETVVVPSGSFWMGCNNWDGSTVPDAHCGSDESPYHAVILPTFEIDVTEVTVRQYAMFLNSLEAEGKPNQCSTNAGDGECIDTDNPILTNVDGQWSAAPDRAQHPVRWVSWYGAQAYCEWAGKRLPTEAEWEMAARGGCAEYEGQGENCKSESYMFPWGNLPDYCQAANKKECVNDTVEVAQYPPSAHYGLYDLAGNVWEWVSDWYGSDYYCAGPDAETEAGVDGWKYCTDGEAPFVESWQTPSGPPEGSLMTAKGGYYGSPVWALRTSQRSKWEPNEAAYFLGFRCAK